MPSLLKVFAEELGFDPKQVVEEELSISTAPELRISLSFLYTGDRAFSAKSRILHATQFRAEYHRDFKRFEIDALCDRNGFDTLAAKAEGTIL